ncbi:MAG: glycosyltransferase family 2 protein [Terrimicrobiaceae bacterium]
MLNQGFKSVSMAMGAVADSPLQSKACVIDDFASRTLVIIPAHNEEECVAGVVQSLREREFTRIRVVDNASTDRTAVRAREAGAEVLSHPHSGYGLACWLGGREVPDDVEWLLYCNADASDDLDALERFAALAPDHDLILGCRTLPEDRRTMTLPQRFGNWLAPFLIHLLWRHRFHDLGPQRAIRCEAYRRINMQDRGFGWTVEMQVRAVEERLRIAEIPVRSFPRPAGKSKISGTLRGTILAGWMILTTLARLGVQASRRHSFTPGKAGMISKAGQRSAVPGRNV